MVIKWNLFNLTLRETYTGCRIMQCKAHRKLSKGHENQCRIYRETDYTGIGLDRFYCTSVLEGMGKISLVFCDSVWCCVVFTHREWWVTAQTERTPRGWSPPLSSTTLTHVGRCLSYRRRALCGKERIKGMRVVNAWHQRPQSG